MIEKNPFTWLVEVNGMPVDARWLPEPVQEELVRAGIIPHVSQQGDR